ncbi:MAG: DUF4337 domain-containing protein [Acidobacteria bacterium]|nr:DUF4337 domain-containing protein [Acidobacteriota bacterium]
MGIIKFLGSTPGRWTRGIVGIAIAAIGIVLGGWWFILAAVGVVVFLAGALDFCLFAPLLGKPFRGSELRASF